jgi:(E)-4-hydroxy-3-methylbut-2-enyl-diphosphate synthase
MRIGVNGGSIDRSRFPEPTPEALVDSALGHIRILEELDYYEYIVSLKAFDVPTAVAAYQMMAEERDCPLHIGITEAGLPWQGSIRSATGLGTLLSLGLGDTMRISLVGDPVEEVRVCWEVLKSLNLREKGYTLIACPSCGRCEINLQATAEEVNRRLQLLPQPPGEYKVAVMGCVVNGPGEAQEAEIGITGGDGLGLIFRKGKIVRKVPEAQMVDALMEELKGLEGERASRAEPEPDILTLAAGDTP